MKIENAIASLAGETVMITDPDGNHHAFAQAVDPSMASLRLRSPHSEDLTPRVATVFQSCSCS